MNKDTIKEILHIIIAITLGIMAVRFVIWLLPVILIAIFSHYIYKSIKNNNKPKTDKRNNNTTKNKTKKEIKIIDMELDD